MRIPRRELLVSASAAAALVALPGCQRDATTVDVRRFGATGDGVTDDSQAIKAAVAALRSRDTLRFPRGTYRFAQRSPSGTAAIVITRVTDILIEFEPGAELVMDNLDPNSHTGTSHGLLIRGPASRITLRNVSIRWAAGARRSLGDGIRVEGCPVAGLPPPSRWSGRRTPVAGIVVSDCRVQGSPQAGIIMLGVSDIAVTGLRVADTGADGLHFNACRRARIEDYGAANTGDDGLALVTYFADERFTFDDTSHTFAFPALGDWSNADFAIRNVSVDGGKANGVRIAGANRVTLGGLRVAGVRSGSAVMVDSAEPGADVGWNYVASRAVQVSDVTVSNCDTGIHLLARPGESGDQRFTEFDVHVDDARFEDCGNWSVQAESLTDHDVSGLRMADCTASSTSTTGGNGGVGITNAARISLGNILIRHAEPVVVFRAVHAEGLAVGRLSVTIAKSEPPADAAPPCVSINASDGVIDDMELDWSAAPSPWPAVRLTDTGHCGGDALGAPFVIKNLKITPPVADSAIFCA